MPQDTHISFYNETSFEFAKCLKKNKNNLKIYYVGFTKEKCILLEK